MWIELCCWAVKIFTDSLISWFSSNLLTSFNDLIIEKWILKMIWWLEIITKMLTPPLLGWKTTLTKSGKSRTNSLYNRSWSRTIIVSTSKALAAWRSNLYPSPFTQPHVLMTTPLTASSFKGNKYLVLDTEQLKKNNNNNNKTYLIYFHSFFLKQFALV